MARAATTGAYSVAVSLRPDACPGVFALHDAADGALARVRLPGGAIDAAALQVVAGCAEDLGDGAVHLTSRGNLQLRGLRRDDPRLAARLAAAGLLPSTTHERARNVLASPLSGIAGGLADVRDLARELDRGLCARPALAALSAGSCSPSTTAAATSSTRTRTCAGRPSPPTTDGCSSRASPWRACPGPGR